MTIDTATSPNRIPWPPLLYGAAAVGAIGLEVLRPAPLPGLEPLGWGIAATGLALDIAAMAVMARARTNVLPHRPAGQLVTTGPFRFTRNPIYLGNTLLLAGGGLAYPSLWPILTALLAAIATHRLAILREEAHLATRFGADWSAYAARTPRWLPWPGRS